jgi:hypothetical protein
MPFEGIKIHAKFVSSLRAERSNPRRLLHSARNDRRDIFNSHKNSMNRKSANFIKVNTLVPQGGSQKSKVKSQKYYGISSLGLFNGLLIYAVLY